MAAATVGLALSLGFQRRVCEQLPLLEQTQQAAAAQGQRALLAFTHSVHGYVLADLRRWDEAAASYLACLRTAWNVSSWREWFYGLWNLPRALAHLRRPEAAVQLLGFADVFYTQRFGTLGWEDVRERLRTRRLVRALLSAPREAQLWAQGQALTMAAAMALACTEAERSNGGDSAAPGKPGVGAAAFAPAPDVTPQPGVSDSD